MFCELPNIHDLSHNNITRFISILYHNIYQIKEIQRFLEEPSLHCIIVYISHCINDLVSFTMRWDTRDANIGANTKYSHFLKLKEKLKKLS